MSKRRTILWLGVLVAVLPFLGFPSAWKTIAYVASGILIAINSYQLNKHKIIRSSKRAERKRKDIQDTPTVTINDGIFHKPPAPVSRSLDSNHSSGDEPPTLP
ncbi:MAG: hypothetical protein AAB355_01590 [Patescibacteria group bacterium]